MLRRIANLRIANLIVATTLALAAAAVSAADPRVELKTSQGVIVIELNPAAAPKTVENFLEYVKSGHYDGTIFHRVIDGFMAQGGGYAKGMKEKETRAQIQNEANNGLKNVTGSIAMARMAAPHSASAQFFINLNDNAFLDYPGRDGWGYAVFGKVVDGLPVVQKIGKVPTGNADGHQNVPTTPVVIESARLLKEPSSKEKK